MLFNEGLWGKIMKSKYFNSNTMDQWIRSNLKSFKGASNIKKGLVKVFLIFGHLVAWKFGSGGRISLGEDPWIKAVGNYFISYDLRSLLSYHGLKMLAYVGVLSVHEYFPKTCILCVCVCLCMHMCKLDNFI